MAEVIRVKNLERVYQTEEGILKRSKKDVYALKGITFAVQEGEIFGLLGPNGAGKTTTIKILTTMLTPTAGEVEILGLNPVTQYKKIRPQINFILGGERNLYWRLSAYDNLAYFADLYYLPKSIQKKKIFNLLELVGLTEVANRRVETFSKGMKQRLQIARGLLNQPKLLFLDEPTIGLDPVSAKQLRTILKQLRSEGTTILLTTHYMQEADELCDRIAFIDKGKIIALDSPELLKKWSNQATLIECNIINATSEEISMIRTLAEIKHFHLEERETFLLLSLQTDYPQQIIHQLYQILTTENIMNLTVKSPTLEDVYLQIIGGKVS